MAGEKARDTLRQRLAAGALRLRLNDGLHWASWVAVAALGGMLLLVLLQRLFYLDAPMEPPAAGDRQAMGLLAYFLQTVLASMGMPFWALLIMLGLSLAPLVAGSAGYLASPRGPLAAAIVADERLGLRARLSSALAIDARTAGTPMAPALLADARRHAAKLDVGRDFPVRAPRQAAWAGIGLLVLAGTLLLVPQADVLGREQRIGRRKKRAEDVRLAARKMEEELRKALKRKPPRSQKASRDLPGIKLDDELSKLVKELQEAADRDQAITKLNKLRDKARMAHARVAAMAEMMQRMQKMKQTGDDAGLPKGAGRKLGGAMMNGDFQKAADELRKLKDMLEAKLKDKQQGGLSQKEKAELKRDLERLAKMTDEWKELSDQFQKAADRIGEGDSLEAMGEALEGLEELAKLLKDLGVEGADPQALAGECQQVQITQEMIDQLKKMLRNARRCPVCRKLSCLNCGKPRCACQAGAQCSCQPGDCQSCGLAQIPGLGGQCPGGGSSPGGSGAGTGASAGAGGKGPGMGGPGQGRGGIAPEEEHKVGFAPTKVRGKLGEGRIVSHMFVKGLPSVTDDEKRSTYRAAHDAAARAASEEVNSGRIPRELRDYVRDYFTSTKPGSQSGGGK
jgi:hypothetical protein